MILFILVIVAVIFKLLRLAKLSALVMCCLIPLYFLLSIPFIFGTALVGDHCPILSDAIQSQVSLVCDQDCTLFLENVIMRFLCLEYLLHRVFERLFRIQIMLSL